MTTPTDIPRDIAAFAVFAVRRFFADRMTQAAGALTYSTLLALVPLTVIAFAVLSNFAAFDTAKARLQELFFDAVVPEVGVELQSYFTDFTGNAQNLTAVGTVALAVTAVLLLSTIEATLNRVWRVERPRPWFTRILIFWAVLTMGPLLLGLSFTLTSDALASLRQWGAGAEVIGRFEASGGILSGLLAILTQSLAFALLYKVVPARSVRLRDAAVGGLVAGIAFQGLRWGFNAFVTSGSTYETIYGAVAVFPIFLIWIYASWMVIILGAVVAAALPDWWHSRDPLIGVEMSPRLRLELAVAVLAVLSERARQGGALDPDTLKDRIPIDAREETVDRLTDAGYVVVTDGGHLALCRDLQATPLGALVADLGLSLTAAEPDTGEDARARALARIAGMTGSLPECLDALARAEARHLDTPLAELLCDGRVKTGQAA